MAAQGMDLHTHLPALQVMVPLFGSVICALVRQRHICAVITIGCSLLMPVIALPRIMPPRSPRWSVRSSTRYGSRMTASPLVFMHQLERRWCRCVGHRINGRTAKGTLSRGFMPANQGLARSTRRRQAANVVWMMSGESRKSCASRASAGSTS